MGKIKGTKLHFKSPTAERRHASCVGGWRGSNPRRPAPMEQGMPALTFRLLRASHQLYSSGPSKHGFGIFFWKEHAQLTFPDDFIIVSALTQQGPLRYNCCASSYNSPTERMVAGRPLPNTKPVKPSTSARQCAAVPVVNVLSWTAK